MTYIAVVKSILPNGNAVIEAARSNACSSDCVNCQGCFDTGKTFTAVAVNQLNALPGDSVKVYMSDGTVIKSAAFLYLIPSFLLVLVYCVLSFGETIKIIGAVAGFFVSFLIIRLFFVRVYKKDENVFTITEIMR